MTSAPPAPSRLRSRRFARGLLGAGILTAVAAKADVPHVFSEGDALDADTMNENFQTLDARLAKVQAAIEALEQKKATLVETAASAKATQAQLKVALDPPCPAGYTHDESEAAFTLCTLGQDKADQMVKVSAGPSAFWIDRFEVSLWEHQDGGGLQVSDPNYPPEKAPLINGFDPLPWALSRKDALPNPANWFQARAMCDARGKRLPHSSEWHLAAAGTPDPAAASDGAQGQCLTLSSDGPRRTNLGSNCRSKWGAEDMIGNLWEWTLDWHFSVRLQSPQTDKNHPITKLDFADKDIQGWPPFPPYVSTWSQDKTWGIASANPDGLAYAGRPSALLRGGSYRDGAAAGKFALSAYASLNGIDATPTPPDPDASLTTGFRCLIPRSRP